MLVHSGDLGGLVPSKLLEDVFWEAVDVFCAMYPKPEQRCGFSFLLFALLLLLLDSLAELTRRSFRFFETLTSCRCSAALVEYLGTTCWGLSADRVREMLTMHRPTVQSSPTTFTAGRVTLPIPAEVVCFLVFSVSLSHTSLSPVLM